GTFLASADDTDPLRLTVSEVSHRIVASNEGPRMYAIGKVENTSAKDAANIQFRVNLFDDANHLLDTFVAGTYGLVVPRNASSTFRVHGPISVLPADIKRTEVTVERARVRAKWD